MNRLKLFRKLSKLSEYISYVNEIVSPFYITLLH